MSARKLEATSVEGETRSGWSCGIWRPTDPGVVRVSAWAAAGSDDPPRTRPRRGPTVRAGAPRLVSVAPLAVLALEQGSSNRPLVDAGANVLTMACIAS